MNYSQIAFAWYYSHQSHQDMAEFLTWQERIESEGVSKLMEFFSVNSTYSLLGSLEHYKMVQNFFHRLEFSLSQNIHFTFPGNSDYPSDLLHIFKSPYWLSYYGQPVWTSLFGLSVVGSREPSELSLNWMENELGPYLKSQDCYIVSGGARGVDQKAHALALRYQRPTVVVLPSGLGCMYPDSLHHWTQSILGHGGAILSEYGFHTPMCKHHFVQRNRIIPALSLATLLIEARRRSGTLITAQAALDQNKPLFIVPTHPYDINARGGLDLLAEGATLVRDCKDLEQFLRAEAVTSSAIKIQEPLDLVVKEK